MIELCSICYCLVMPEKITTIEDLAIMIQRTMASKEDVQGLRQEMKGELKDINSKLDKLENALLENHEPRLVRQRNRALPGNSFSSGRRIWRRLLLIMFPIWA